MKHARLFLLSSVAVFSLVACGGNNNSSGTQPAPGQNNPTPGQNNPTPGTGMVNGCANGAFCLFEHQNFQGRVLATGDSNSTKGVLTRSDWDLVSSVVNNTSKTVCLYTAGGASDGQWYNFVSVPANSSLAFVGEPNNDKADAWTLESGSCFAGVYF